MPRFKDALNDLIPFVVSLSNHERNQQITVHPEPVEGIDQRFLDVGGVLFLNIPQAYVS